MPRHALISGASIAGPALAHELHARGWRTTIVERAMLLVSGFALVYPGTVSDVIGFGLLIAAVTMQQLRMRRVLA